MKKIIIILIILGMVGIIVAGGELIRTDTTISLDRNKVNLIKQNTLDKQLNLNSSEIICSPSYCYSKIGGSLNMNFIVKNIGQSNEELVRQRDAFILDKLNGYADYLISRNNEIKTGGGNIIVNEK